MGNEVHHLGGALIDPKIDDMGLLNTITRTFLRQPAAGAPIAASNVQICTVDPARFRLGPGEWRDRLGDGLDLTLSFSCMRSEESDHSVEVRIVDQGLDVQAVVEVNDQRLLVYLGNYFVVPERLRRAGLCIFRPHLITQSSVS